ncbi:MAG: hypothetical protein KGM24_06870, partial [Elusimicrobia bacterium]|nr:hypothetical protein [Elusimicrobiota bacterium]
MRSAASSAARRLADLLSARSRALGRLSIAALAAAILWRAPTPRLDRYAVAGRYLLHGFAAPDARSLPAARLVGALRLAGPARLYAAADLLLLALLVLALEGELESGAAAWTAAAAAAVAAWHWSYPHDVLALFVLAVAGLAVRRARRPTPARSLVLALSIGSSLLLRSTLAFLPLVLAPLALRGSPGVSKKTLRANALILLLVPYLFLLPWILSNWRLHRRFIPFEDGEAAANVAAGALGLVGTVEGPWQGLLGADDSLRAMRRVGRSPVAWAAAQVAAHPLRYAGACLARLGLALAWCLPFSLLALWALWRGRRRRGFAELGALCAYFLGVHCLMSIQRIYFYPLLPLLVVVSATLIPPGLAPGALLSPRSAGRVLLGAVLLGLVLSAFSAAALTFPPVSAGALDRALARRPADAWLLTRRGAM